MMNGGWSIRAIAGRGLVFDGVTVSAICFVASILQTPSSLCDFISAEIDSRQNDSIHVARREIEIIPDSSCSRQGLEILLRDTIYPPQAEILERKKGNQKNSIFSSNETERRHFRWLGDEASQKSKFIRAFMTPLNLLT